MSTKYQGNLVAEGADRAIARLAAAQFGVVSHRQLLAKGVRPAQIQHRIATGRLTPVKRGVYVLPGNPKTWQQRVMAASLGVGEDASISHGSAAELFQLPGAEREVIHLTVPRRGLTSNPGLILHRATLPPYDIVAREPLRVTHPARTLFDLARIVDVDTLEEAVDEALARKLVTMTRLRWQLRQMSAKGRPGIGRMRALLDVERRSDSSLETRFVRLVKAHGLPSPVQQYRIVADGRLIARVDCAYPRERIAIELDSARFHIPGPRWERDIRVMNALLRLGWTPLRFTWDDVHDRPKDVVAEIVFHLTHL